MKNLLRPLAHAVYGLCFFLMLLLPYHRYEWALGIEVETAGELWEDTGECAVVIHLLLCICVLTQGVLTVCAKNRREKIVCAVLLLSACILWGVKAYG
ncbi:MAG: hypothetical protein LBU11_06390 [Zoogloeaceae bacterium]|jgi:hypothetical protein|nr:hypothetical protein [Zoogloeaceae bacterium]